MIGDNEELLTVPAELGGYQELYLTGNEYISIPQIDPQGRIDSINVLLLEQRGLLEFRGGEELSLLEPVLIINDRPFSFQALDWRYEWEWLPAFRTIKNGRWTLAGEIVAPPGFRGFYYRLTITNRGSEPLEAFMGWRGCLNQVNHVIFNRREIAGDHRICFNAWSRSMILEAGFGLPLAALALAMEPEREWHYDREEKSFRVGTPLRLEPQKSHSIYLYVAANLEENGAGTTAMDLRRHGAAALRDHAAQWLKQRYAHFTDGRLATVLNRNLFFSYFYSLGRCLDTDDLAPVTSRSPRYYVSAAYWSRDTLLWSFPAVVLVDPCTARELLVTVFKRHLKYAGDHAHYINGVLLYPGFELDQLAAYPLALRHYLDTTGDRSLMEEPVISTGLAYLVQKAEQQRDSKTGLYRTFLDPSDDPVMYPYLVYSNALLQCSFTFLACLQKEKLWQHQADFARKADTLKEAIYRYGKVKTPRGPMFAWAVDGEGRYQLYDNPPGSLQLLPYYGFCSRKDEVYRNTVEWIRSKQNSYWHEARFQEAGSLHSGMPWPLAAANDLLAANKGGAAFLLEAPMDNGFCCETVHPDTGKVHTGAAFASAAGFIAYALWFANRKK